MTKIELQWKEFNINLSQLDKELKEAYPSYVGNQAYSILELWFDGDISEEQKLEIEEMWTNISEESVHATSYKSKAQIQEEQESKKQSAKDKLKKLGLTDEEISVLMSV